MSIATTTTSATSATTTIANIQTLCDTAEGSFLRNAVLNHVHLALLAITLVSIVILVIRYWQNPITVHGNLLILFANIIAFSFINYLAFFIKYLRDSILFFSYQNSCQLLAPLWLVAITIGPCYFYTIGYPALHFCIMVERVRATFMADRYEGSGQQLGIRMAIGIWLISLGYMAFVVIAAYMDPEMTGHLQPFFSMTSKYNSQLLLWSNVVFTSLVIFTAICAWRVTMANRRIRRISRQKYQNYSLSRNYQLNENALAMRLILPLDIFYALLYTLYQAITIAIRASRPHITPNDYIFYFTLVNTLLFFYSAVTIIVYIRFLGFVSRCQKRTVVEGTRPGPEHAKIYFRQLATQWK